MYFISFFSASNQAEQIRKSFVSLIILNQIFFWAANFAAVIFRD